jgi:ADP-ribose pyrophosphatase YjhB (NUDIX family)
MKKTLSLGRIPKDKARGWTVLINDRVIGQVVIDGEAGAIEMIELISRFGVWTYGLCPEGHDGWIFEESGGGGVFTILYSITPDGKVLVGLIEESRANMGGKAYCCIGGFTEFGQKPNAGEADRELEEETGLKLNASPLPGFWNCNRAFWRTLPGSGSKYYYVQIPFDWLKPASYQLLTDEDGGFIFKEPDQINHAMADKVRFWLWTDCLLGEAGVGIPKTQDNHVPALIGLLMAKLERDAR